MINEDWRNCLAFQIFPQWYPGKNVSLVSIPVKRDYILGASITEFYVEKLYLEKFTNLMSKVKMLLLYIWLLALTSFLFELSWRRPLSRDSRIQWLGDWTGGEVKFIYVLNKVHYTADWPRLRRSEVHTLHVSWVIKYF